MDKIIKTLDKEQIQNILPHRPPMLLIDRMIDVDPGKRVVAIKDVTTEDEFFKGHFPGRPIMPGASIVEAMAQTAILLYHSAYKDIFKKITDFYLGSVKAHFMNPVVPGDQLRLEVETVKLLITGGFVAAKAFVGDKLIAEAELVFVVKQ
jgi:3-hydroxyacyl-[acyl-carrier-protein] dehydratase